MGCSFCSEDSNLYKRFCMMVRVFGGVLGIVVLVLGIVQLVTSAANPRTVVNAIYQIIFGLVILICEIRIVRLLVYTKFLTHFFGLGMFYVFVGGLSIGGDWWQYLIGGLLIGVGTVYLILGLLNRSMYSEADVAKQEAKEAERKKGVEIKLNATGIGAVDKHIDAAASNAANNAIEQKKKELNPWDQDDNTKKDKNNPFDQM